MDPTRNFAIVEVSTGYDNDDTSIVLTTGHGAKLPAPGTDGAFNLTWWNSAVYPNPADDPNAEIVRVTARSTDTLTVTRAQEGTSGSNKNTAGGIYKMVLSPTKKTIDDIIAVLATKFTRDGDSTGAHQYIGTNDSFFLVFKTNNANRGWFTNSGQFYVAGAVAFGTSTFSGVFRVNKNTSPRSAYSDGMGQFIGDDSGGNHILIDVANAEPKVLFRHSTGTMASPGATTSGNFMGGFHAYGYDTSVFAFGGRVSFAAAETWGTTAHGTALWIYTTPIGSTTSAAVAVIDAAGRMGLGDTTPIPKLEVVGAQNANSGLGASVNQMLILRHVNATNGNAAGLGFAVTNTDDNMTALITGHRIGSQGQGQLRFHTKQSTSAGSSFPPVFAMLIDQAGSIFMGATAAAADASALLELSSTTKGLLLPRMTTTQKNAISSPAAGLVVYDTDLGKMCIRVAAAWETVTSA